MASDIASLCAFACPMKARGEVFVACSWSVFAYIVELLCLQSIDQARKKSIKISFLGTETARWGGGLPREGVVIKMFVPSLESLSSLGLEGRSLECSMKFARMFRTPKGVQKVCATKARTHFSFPNLGAQIYILSLWGKKLQLTAKKLQLLVEKGSPKQLRAKKLNCKQETSNCKLKICIQKQLAWTDEVGWCVCVRVCKQDASHNRACLFPISSILGNAFLYDNLTLFLEQIFENRLHFWK